MLASRLLSILMLLQTRGRMSASQLAAEFEVSPRTILRDIDQLSAAGVPVYAERGRTGGFELMDGYRTKLTGLNQSEAEALMLAGLPGPAAQLGLSDLLTVARLKLLAALPAHVQAERIASRFHLDPVGWFRGADPLPSLQTVARAVWDGRYVALAYGAAKKPMRLGPLGLVLKGGVWYLVARNGRATRTYRVAHIHDAWIEEVPFERPPGFDLAAYWAQASRDYEAGLYRASARVRLSPRGLALLHLLGPYVASAADASAAPAGPDGWVSCDLPIESVEDGVRELMRLGPEVQVLEPPELRAALRAALAATARLYGGGEACGA